MRRSNVSWRESWRQKKMKPLRQLRKRAGAPLSGAWRPPAPALLLLLITALTDEQGRPGAAN